MGARTREEDIDIMTIKEVVYQIVGRDYMSPVLDRMRASAESTNHVMRNLRSQTIGMNANMREAAREIPGMGRALSMVKNPLLMGGALVAGVSAVMVDATDRAKAFNTEFRNLANINLSRSIGELNRLKSTIATTAYAGGHDIGATSRAYFDVQSITGMYGAQASPMVRQGMEFARLMGADPNEWVAGLAKAQANYGFSNADIGKYQSAAYASLVAGAMTFDQLAKASPVFAGSAAASGQSFTDAMKMFTLFTMRTKSTDEAATMTNSLFRDLTREGTIKGFLNAGINPYTSDGSFKSVIQLMTELADVFSSQQTQLQVNNLKNAFSGSEGLTAMLNAAAGGAEQLTAQLRNFDNAELDLNRAREIARNDLNLLESDLRNKFNTSLTQLGEALLPARIELVRLGIAAVDFVRDVIDWKGAARREGTSIADWATSGLERWDSMSESDRAAFKASVESARGQAVATYGTLPSPSKVGLWAAERGLAWPILGAIGSGARSRETNIGKWGAAVSTYDSVLSQIAALENPVEAPTGGNGGSDTVVDAQSAISTAIGGGRQQKVINVTIGSLVGSQSFNSTVRESRDDITTIVEEALIRAIYGAEQLAVR